MKQVINDLRAKLLPFSLTALLVLIDQITKALIVRFVAPDTIAWSMGGDFLRIVHARNHGIAFSVGSTLPDQLRTVFFALLPLLVIAVLLVYYLRARGLPGVQRWSIAAIIGGGLGNLIDRVFRPHGVVDFIDVKFYGIFGLQRWPTFNVADSSVVVAGIVLVIALIFDERGNHE